MSRRNSSPTTGQMGFWTDVVEPPPLYIPPTPPLPRTEEPAKTAGFFVSEDLTVKGTKGKIRTNLEIIKALYKIEAEKRLPSPEEMALLARYSAFGGLAKVFDPSPKNPEISLFKEVKETLDPLDYKAAKASVVNAFYTDPAIIQAMWAYLERLGFSGGRVLEPAAATGLFFAGMPPALRAASELTAVELDRLSGRLGLYLHPDVTYHLKGLEETTFQPGYFDLVISNAPFGDYGVFDNSLTDAERALCKSAIHDYYFIKAAQLVRRGGLVAMITSRFTLDKKEDAVRRYLAERFDLVGTVRLPSATFSAFAGTDVITDILFLQRKAEDGLLRDPVWLDAGLVELKGPRGPEEFRINDYYTHAHPHAVLGQLTCRTGPYGAKLLVDGEIDPTTLTDRILAALPDTGPLYTPVQAKEQTARFTVDASLDKVREGSYGYQIVGGVRTVYQKVKGLAVPVNKDKTTLDRLVALVDLVALARNVLDQCLHGTDAALTASQAQLGDAYDHFVRKYGYLNAKYNRQLFADDPNAPFLRALERWNEEQQTATKTKVFSERTIRTLTAPTGAASAVDALAICLNQKGHIDLDYMATLYGKTKVEIVAELGDDLFHDPVLDQWQTKAEYLSGNVLQKLEAAADAAQANPLYERNAAALRAVLPLPLLAEEITVSLGNTWVPVDVVSQFLKELYNPLSRVNHMDEPNYHPSSYHWSFANVTSQVTYVPALGRWVVERKGKVFNTLTDEKWGTNRRNLFVLLEAALNGSEVKVFDTTKDNRQVLNATETIAAREKVNMLHKAFRQWVWLDPKRKQMLTDTYNRTFRGMVRPTYDGSYLTLPGTSLDLPPLRKHQRDGIARILQGENTLLWHLVGAGKAQPLDAKVLTPTGWRKMGELKVGDQVMAETGKPTRIIKVFPQGKKQIFRVEFSDGSSTECCDDHLWLTYNYRERCGTAQAAKLGKDWPYAKPKVRTLAEIRRTLIDEAHPSKPKNHSIPMVAPVEFKERSVKLDPYLMGVLLGDGHIRAKGATFTSADPEIADLVKLPDHTELSSAPKQKTVALTYTIKGTRWHNNPVTEILKDYGLQGLLSSHKFVPEDYLFNTIDVRLGVLQGLMDTDGYVDRRGTSCYYATVSPKLAENVAFLVQSLGGTAITSVKEKSYRNKEGAKVVGQPCYQLTVSLPPTINPFRLPRKRDLVVPKTKYQPTRYIVNVVPVGEKEAQCIMVDAPSHLYVTDNFIVTHNSWSMIISSMELKRLGLRNRPLHVVPNALLEQYATEFYRVYPHARILVVNSKKMEPKTKQETLARIATEDWDAILINASAFQRIPLNLETWEWLLMDQIAELEAAIEEREDDEDQRLTVKQLRGKLNRAEYRLQERRNQARVDKGGLTFEQMGIDALFVDEFHQYRNLFFMTERGHLPGIGGDESGLAFDLFVKSQFVTRRCTKGHILGANATCSCGAERAPRGQLIGATGTAITNSISEMFTLQRFFQMDLLIQKGLENFDAWASTFGETETVIEMNPSGKGWRTKERFVNFVNVPELLDLFKQVADIWINPDTLGLERPALATGAPIPIELDPIDELLDVMEQCATRAENLKHNKFDNMLAIMGTATRAATDVRLVGKQVDHPRSKANRLVEEVFRIWRETSAVQLPGLPAPVGLTQLVFLDIGVPGGDAFDLYNDLRAKWIALGVPAEQIAFATDYETDAQRKALYDAVNAGMIRILLATTGRAGMGVNIQRLLIALHHVDITWTPASVEQREGRILRPGNLNPMVYVYRYIVKRSLDFHKWHLLELKAKANRQLFMTDSTSRTVQDLDQAVLSFAQMKAIATGDPLLMEKVKIETDLNRLYALHDKYMQDRRSVDRELRELEISIPASRRRAQEYAQAYAAFAKWEEKPPVKVQGRVYKKRSDAGEHLQRLISMKLADRDVVDLGYATVSLVPAFDGVWLEISCPPVRYAISPGDSATGHLMKVDNFLKKMEGDAQFYERQAEGYADRLAFLSGQGERRFAYQAELDAAYTRFTEIEAELTRRADHAVEVKTLAEGLETTA